MHLSAIMGAINFDRCPSANEPSRPVLHHVEIDRPRRGVTVGTSMRSSEREYLTTEEAADLLGLRPQTLRKAYSSDGCYFSVVPKKAANRRLYWKADLVRSLIEGA